MANDGVNAPHQETFHSRIQPYFTVAEKIFLVGILAGGALAFFNYDGRPIIQGSLLGLSIVYFQSAFRMIEVPRQSDEKYGFMDLLALTIVPKVMWMTSGISLFGLFLYLQQLEHDGYKRLLLIGALSIAISLVIIGYAFLTGIKHLNYVRPLLFRAVAVLLADGYILSL